ncbi:MAG TPA: TIGR03067 domain-containing protein [Gemmataceae bacterium]|jgi:uncharacterized protein (TIGR03067 family)|nr:TIGR03067 domain-containing protein [Gemmataceae bacterium]
MNAVAVLGLALSLAAPMPKEAPKKAEPPAIVGEWECVQFIGGGQMFPVDVAKTIRMEYTADGKLRGDFGPEKVDAKYTTDLKKDPAEVEQGVDGKMNHGIFKADKDMLVLCFAEGGGERPKKFESATGTRVLLLTFKRTEKKKE